MEPHTEKKKKGRVQQEPSKKTTEKNNRPTHQKTKENQPNTQDTALRSHGPAEQRQINSKYKDIKHPANTNVMQSNKSSNENTICLA